jgi:hypothetical protein
MPLGTAAGAERKFTMFNENPSVDEEKAITEGKPPRIAS